MIFSPVIRRFAACVFLLASGTVFGQAGSGAPGAPDAPGDKSGIFTPFSVREIWVPAADLDPVLSRYPRAVPLAHDELFTLLRDAHPAPDPTNVPPERAVLRQARFDAHLVSGPDAHPQVRVEAECEVESLSDAWADVPLGLPGIALGTAEIDTPAASLRRVGDTLNLRLQGRGLHRLHLGFLLNVTSEKEGSSIAIPRVEGIGEFTLHLPSGTHADGPRGCAVQPEGEGITARVPLGRQATPDRLNWRTPPPAPAEAGVLLQDNWLDATVAASQIKVRQQVTLRPALGRLPTEARLSLPAAAHAVRVENTTGRWDLGADGLHAALVPDPTKNGQATFTVVYDLPLSLDNHGGIVRLDLPLLEVTGAHRITGGVVLSHGHGVQVRRVDSGAMALPAADGIFPWYEQNAPGFVAGFTLSGLPTADAAPPVALTLEARLATPRFSVDADTHATFAPDGVQLQRTLTVHVEEGELFTARVRLPPGETLLALRAPDGSATPDWRQEGDDLLLAWNAGLADPSKTILALDTRATLSPPKTDAPAAFSLGAVLVPGAERLTGYVALDADPALRLVTTGGEDRLERRDGRTTPVRGGVAWFYREDFHLALRVERRAAEAEARFTGYALPLAGAVEVHAQLDFHFLFSGVETVRIRVPADAADAFFFTGERIAERRRDGDVWTIRFQGEQRGNYALGVQATIPAPADKGDAQRFHFRLPALTPLDTARWSGAWVVEANPDTEIRFTATGATEVDTLHAPALAGYQPRRRIIGVFDFTGGAAGAAIDLDGIRHPAAGVAAAIVDKLDLETFASTSGVARHRATLRARTAADGFFNVRLPEGASLWSLTRDGAPVKPVGGAAGELRVELPGGRAPSNASTVVVIYETPGQPWATAGWWRMAAPGFDPGVPVLQSRWKLHVPDGFDYRFPDAPIGLPPATAAALGDLLLPRLGQSAFRAAQWIYYYPRYMAIQQVLGSSGIADPHAAVVDLPPWMAARLAKDGPVFATASRISSMQGEQVQELTLPSATVDATFGVTAGLEKKKQSESVAREGEERIESRNSLYGNEYAKDEARGHLLNDLSQSWGQPARKPVPKSDVRTRDDAGPAAIERKLASIIVPSIEFHATLLSDAIEYLRQESRRLDSDPDAENRGVNIFLKLPATNVSSSPIPGLPDVVSPTANTRVTLTLNRIPLLEALKYVASQAGMKVKVEPYAVSIVPVSEQTDAMVTADFHVPRRFFTNQTSGQAAPAPDSPLSSADAKTFLEASGVTFPLGASATYLSPTNKLVVRNTRENIDLIQALVEENQPRPKAAPSPFNMTIVPSSKDGQSMVTAEIAVGRDFLGNNAFGRGSGSARGGARDVSGAGGVTIARQDAKAFLESSGVAFPPGASAVYLPDTGKLIVHHTREALDLIGSRVEASGAPTSAIAGGYAALPTLALLNGRRLDERVAGLLPIRLDLPDNGQFYEFAGGGEPGALDFHYTDWRTAARWRWISLTLGALGFLCLAAGWAHPWRRTFYATLALTFLPLIAAPSAAPACNALLAGWLWALLGWGVTRFLLRRRLAVVLVCVAAMLPAAARAEPKRPATPPAATPTPSPELVIVPYDATRPIAGQTPARYYLPYERFLDLWDTAKRNRRPPAPEPPPGGERFTLSAAHYDARLTGETLAIDATLDLQTSGDGWVAVPLRFDAGHLGTLTLDGTPAALDGEGILWVGTPGAHRVNATLRVPAGIVAAGTTLAWTVPPTAATRVTLLLPRPDLRADLWGDTPGGGAVEEISLEGRKLTASVGGTATVNLAFHDTSPPAPAAGQPALARVVARLVAGPQQETVRAEINLTFPGNTQNHFTVFLDRTLTLTDLDAPDIRQWRLDTGGERPVLEITLNTPARDGYRLALSADRPLPALPAERRAFPVISAQAGRVESTAALRTEGAVELSLPDGPPSGARRVEDASHEAGKPFAAFESSVAAALVYSVRATPEKRTAHINYLYQVGRGKIELAASAHLAPAADGAPLLAADLRLPPGFTVQAVAGASVRQWWRDGDTLSLRFSPGTGPSEVPLVIYLVRQFDHAPDTFALQPLTALGFTETDGQTVVAADRSFRVGLTLSAGVRARDLSGVDPATAAAEFQVKTPLERQRAFRYRGAGFDVSATLESQPARWQAQWVTQAAVREGVLALETHVNVEARQGAVDALEFSLPAGLAEARVSGADVRETVAAGTGKERRLYRVLFQNPLYAGRESEFVVRLELPLGADGHAVLPDLAFPDGNGGRSAGGFLLVENDSSGEMTLDPHGLDPAIEKEVPFLPAQIVAGTRFFRAAPGTPWSLGVRVTDLEKTAGRAALVAYAELSTTLRAGGEEWHRAVYRLQNRRLQFLPVELPPGTEFIGARVAGESVRVDAGQGDHGTPQLLVPLLKTRPGELSYDVELVYRRPAPGPGGRGREPFFARWQLADPRLPGVPVEKTLWNVWLPPDARLLDSGGNVEPVVAALTETEKLESALYDLRSLSATYGSGRASQQERQRALSNFNQLAESLKRGTTPDSSRRTDEAAGQGALLKQPDAASQNAAVNRKQDSIRRELDSLSTANRVAQQAQSNQRDAARNQGSPSFDGFVNYGSPIQSATSTVGNAPAMDNLWRDNRALDSQKSFDVNGGLSASGTRPAAAMPTVVNTGQLALNDSLAVDLPGSGAKRGANTYTGTASLGDDKMEIAVGGHLSTARAGDKDAAAPAAPTLRSAKEIPFPLPTGNSDFKMVTPAMAIPGLPAASVPAASSESHAGSLRSVGRISLAVDFPQEGQVYHFEKLKADARLTLWSARPGRFAPLGWLGVLLAGVGVVWMVRRGRRWRTAHLMP